MYKSLSKQTFYRWLIVSSLFLLIPITSHADDIRVTHPLDTTSHADGFSNNDERISLRDAFYIASTNPGDDTIILGCRSPIL